MFKRVFLALISVLLTISLSSCEFRPTVSITIVDNENVIMVDGGNLSAEYINHYKLWLEEQTGYNIEINEITVNYSSQYLAQAIADETIETDIIIINSGENYPPLLTEEEAYSLTDKFLPLDSYIVEGTNLYNVFDEYADEGIREYLSCEDSLYFFPTANLSKSMQNGQSLWINAEWLNVLGQDVPTTTEELIDVLYQFKTGDPNNDGVADEIAFIGSVQSDDMKSHYALINSFVYFNPKTYGFYEENGQLQFSPTDSQFREALIYLNELYEYGYIHNGLFTLSDSGLRKMVNDPDNIIGIFSASHLSELSDEDTEYLESRYIPLAPIMGDEQNAVMNTVSPMTAAAILRNTDNPEECFKLLDTMLSEEAFLVAMYGEEGVDWDYAESGDIDIFGQQAEIVTEKPMSGVLQDNNFDGIGTMIYYPHLTDGVQYTNYYLGYLDAEAYNANQEYFKEDRTGYSLNYNLRFNTENEYEYRFDMLRNYIDASIEQFVTGLKSPLDDEAWEEYLQGFDVFSDVFTYFDTEIDF